MTHVETKILHCLIFFYEWRQTYSEKTTKNTDRHHFMSKYIQTDVEIYREIPGHIHRLHRSSISVCLKMLCTPLYPMVLLIIIPFLNGYFIGNIPNIFRQTHLIYHQYTPNVSKYTIHGSYGYCSIFQSLFPAQLSIETF